MPELPEVETIRRGLESRLKGRRLTGIELMDPTLLTGHRRVNGHLDTAQDRLRGMIGDRIERIGRHGKFLLFEFASQRGIALSLRMTGRLIWGAPEALARVRFSLDSGADVLSLTDKRRLGEMHPLTSEELARFRGQMGPDAWNDFDPVLWAQVFKGRRMAIHTALLNQRLIAGVGNIYATEALFRAGLKPQRRLRSLKKQDFIRLGQELKEVLEMGIRHRGCTVDSYRDLFNRKGRAQMYLKVYGKRGQPCPRCRSSFKYAKITGRGVTYCPQCQH